MTDLEADAMETSRALFDKVVEEKMQGDHMSSVMSKEEYENTCWLIDGWEAADGPEHTSMALRAYGERGTPARRGKFRKSTPSTR